VSYTAVYNYKGRTVCHYILYYLGTVKQRVFILYHILVAQPKIVDRMQGSSMSDIIVFQLRQSLSTQASLADAIASRITRKLYYDLFKARDGCMILIRF
jgi:hypothetical protein